jgi:prepilin signal peptidase PulO-like enzyme (type II secretory pathway)
MLIIIALLGLVFGSFTNAWVWRTSQDMNVAEGRSVCPHCKHQLAWYDLVPLLSYIGLKGKCRYCHKPIGAQYPLVELGTMLLFAGLYVFSVPSGWFAWVQLAISLIVAVLLVAAFVYDAKYMQLPEKFMLPAVVLGVLSLGLNAYKFGWDALTGQLIGLGLVLLVYIGMWYFSGGKWLGAGDIRIVAVMGLFLPPKQLLVALFVAYLVGAVYGVYVLRKSKQKKGVRVPFGPFLIIGFYVGLFFGARIANWYLNLL